MSAVRSIIGGEHRLDGHDLIFVPQIACLPSPPSKTPVPIGRRYAGHARLVYGRATRGRRHRTAAPSPTSPSAQPPGRSPPAGRQQSGRRRPASGPGRSRCARGLAPGPRRTVSLPGALAIGHHGHRFRRHDLHPSAARGSARPADPAIRRDRPAPNHHRGSPPGDEGSPAR